MSTVDRIRFAHWIDLHEMDHIGVDSEALWRELEVLEAVQTLGPRRPEVGETVTVRLRTGPSTYVGVVTKFEGDRFVIGSFSGYISFTTDDLVAVDEDNSAPQ